MGLFEEQFEGIKDRYGNKIKVPEKKPTLKQSICAWGLVNELANMEYPHNFQRERADIRRQYDQVRDGKHTRNCMVYC